MGLWFRGYKAFIEGLGFRVHIGLGFPKSRGTFWGLSTKGYDILGSKLGSPYLRKLPCKALVTAM